MLSGCEPCLGTAEGKFWQILNENYATIIFIQESGSHDRPGRNDAQTDRKEGSVKKGEIWEVNGRKGPLTIRLLQDVEQAQKDGFFSVEIIAGKVQYLSADNNALQLFEGMGTPGDVITMRTTLTHFNKRLDGGVIHDT